MTYIKIHPLNLPEILTEIFLHLAKDKTLYSILFVNRLWYKCSAPILWREIEFYGSRKKPSIYWKKFEHVIHTLNPSYASRLIDFCISGCKISDRTLYQIRDQCPNLQYLIIARCYGFSGKTLEKIVNPNLIHLRLYENSKKRPSKYSQHISDITICKIASTCPNLIYFDIGYSYKITDIALIAIAKNCRKIEYINIGGCKVSDISLKEIAHSCPKLQHIYLPHCDEISDNGISEIASLHPNLLSFSIKADGEENKIIDLSVKKIAELCSKLQYLNLSSQINITDESICALVQLRSNLKELILEECNITDKTINTIKKSCYNLQKLNIKYCNMVSKNAIVAIKTSKPEIKLQTASYPRNINVIYAEDTE